MATLLSENLSWHGVVCGGGDSADQAVLFIFPKSESALEFFSDCSGIVDALPVQRYDQPIPFRSVGIVAENVLGVMECSSGGDVAASSRSRKHVNSGMSTIQK